MKLKFTQTFFYVIANCVKKVSPTKNLLFVFSLSTCTENRFLFCLPAKFSERIFKDCMGKLHSASMLRVLCREIFVSFTREGICTMHSRANFDA